MKIPLAVIVAGFLLLPGYVQNTWADETTDNPTRNGVSLNQLRTHPVRSVEYWQQRDRNKARQTNIGPAPPELIEFMRLDNAFQGYSERPVPVSRESALLRDVAAAMEGLPRAVKRIAERRLFFIALVRDLGGGTGYMDAVANTDGSAAGGFIVLDEEALDRTANAWASWREGSAFKAREGWSLEVRIESKHNDTRVNAIRYILLHELGHVIDAVLGATQIEGGNNQNRADNGFYQLSWTESQTSQTSRFDNAWPERETMAFYSFDASKLDATDVVPVYEWLRSTNFPTLYAASSPAEDFAESFVNYVHVVLDKRPFEVRLQKGGQSERLLGSCWDGPLCESKRATMKRLLRRAEILQ